MPTEKLIVQVYEALEQGAETSVEVAAITGLSVKYCSSLLNELKDAGVAMIIKRNYLRYSRRGRSCHRWGLTKNK